MADLITLSVCLTDIPKEKIKQADNGKKYLNICVAKRRETDQYGNTHTVYVSQTKEEREAKADKVYIGSAKEYVFTPTAATSESVDAMPPADDNDDSLPF